MSLGDTASDEDEVNALCLLLNEMSGYEADDEGDRRAGESDDEGSNSIGDGGGMVHL